jgi:Leucine-rich repeat (LRR) protein
MASLSVLDLSLNKLAQLPAELGEQMPGLQQLYLANNYLKQLPESLGQATGLQDLFLSENGFEEVPKVRWVPYGWGPLFGVHSSLHSRLHWRFFVC